MRVLVLNPPSQNNESISRDLIYGCWCHGKRVASIQPPPLNLMYIATILKNEGHSVKLLDALAEKKRPNDIKGIASNFDIVIIASSNTTFLYDVHVIKILKEINPNLICIFCGPHTTVYPKKALEKKEIDYGVHGEYEWTIKELVNKLSKHEDIRDVLGISYRKGKQTIVTQNRPFIENLDELPIPDRRMIRPDLYFNPLAKRKAFTTALTSRGCIGRCIFCTSPAFYGKKYRLRSAENVLKELEYLVKLGYKDILFRDEIFTAHRKRLEDICHGIIDRKLNIVWASNARIGTLNEDLLRLMKRAGCYCIWFGVESGSQQILDNIKKDIKVEMIEHTFKMARKVGIETHAHLMFGNPGETKETLRQSIDFLKKIKADTMDIGILTPFPGTELFDSISEKANLGDGTQLDIDNVHTKTFFNEYICDLKNKDIEDAILIAYKEFYLRPSYIFHRFFKIRSFTDFVNNVKSGFYTVLFTFKK